MRSRLQYVKEDLGPPVNAVHNSSLILPEKTCDIVKDEDIDQLRCAKKPVLKTNYNATQIKELPAMRGTW